MYIGVFLYNYNSIYHNYFLMIEANAKCLRIQFFLSFFADDMILEFVFPLDKMTKKNLSIA